MTQPNPEAIAEVPVTDAQKHAATEVDKHTPATPDPAPVVHEQTDNGLGELRSMVEGLAKTVNTLVETVGKTASGQDEAPRSVPWTHRGGGHAPEVRND